MREPVRAEKARYEAEQARRERICDAAFTVLMEQGYAGASTLEIATRAKVSKRELYALFANKLGILTAMVVERTKRMRLSIQSRSVVDCESLAAALVSFGSETLRTVSHPGPMALYRLAVAEAERSPEMAALLERAGRQAAREALVDLLSDAQARGILGSGDPMEMARRFLALLWGDRFTRLLLKTAPAPRLAEIRAAARAATDALLKLYPPRTRV